MAIWLAQPPLAVAQLASLDQSASNISGTGDDADGFTGYSTTVPAPNDGTTFTARYAFNVAADAGVGSTRDATGSATHRVDFTANAAGGYRLDIVNRIIGDRNRVSDTAGCEGQANISGVTGTSSVPPCVWDALFARPGGHTQRWDHDESPL
jgi:hypothetical protein